MGINPGLLHGVVWRGQSNRLTLNGVNLAPIGRMALMDRCQNGTYSGITGVKMALIELWLVSIWHPIQRDSKSDLSKRAFRRSMFLRLSQRLFAGGSSPSLKGKCPGTPFSGFPDTHVPLIATAKRYSVPSWLVQTSFLTRVRHEWFYAVGKVPLRCARNYHLISWLTSTIHSWTNVHPCKVSASQWLRLHCSLMAPVHPASIQYQHLPSW